MNIYVNDKKIDYQPLFPLTWGNFFQKLLQEERYIAKDHGIIAIQIDGQNSLQVMTEQSEKIMPEDIDIIKIYTKDSLSITRDGFAKVSILIESIKTEIMGAADFYREGNIKEASGKIVKSMEAIKPIVNFIQSVGMSFSLNFDEIMFHQTTSLRAKIDSFLTTFAELVEAQRKRDYVEIADYLEFNLVEDMSDWNVIVNILLKEVEQKLTGNN